MQNTSDTAEDRSSLISWLATARAFMTIWAGQLVSSIGSRLSNFALGLWVLRTTGSTTEFAITYIMMAVPPILLGPLAGKLADSGDRRRIMIVCDGMAAVLMLVLAASLASGQLAVWHVYLAVGLTALLDTFRAPAYLSSVPLLVDAARLPRANGLAQTSEALSAIVGPLVAGVLVSTISSATIIAFDALTFAVGLVTLAMVRIPRPSNPEGHEEAAAAGGMMAGWRYIHERPGLSGLLSVYGVNHFIFAVASVLIAPLLLSLSGPAQLGLQYSISGVGLLLGGVLLTAWGGPKRLIDGVLLFTAAGGVLLALHGLAPSFWVVAVSGFLLFMTLPVVDASSTSLWQRKVPNHLLGRCIAVQQVLLNAATAIGFASAGPLADQVFEPMLKEHGVLAGSVGTVIGTGAGRGIAFIFVLLGALMSLVAIRAWFVPSVRGLDDLADAPVTTPPVEAEPA